MPPRIVKLLLDKLETDEAFREAFAKSPADALRALGHAKASPACLALKPGATLASPAQIRAQRCTRGAAARPRGRPGGRQRDTVGLVMSADR